MDEVQLKNILNKELAIFFGAVSKRFDAIEQKLEGKADKEQVDHILNTLDGLAKRLGDDDTERVAMNAQLHRHNNWIGQLAKTTKTKLVPEQ